MYTTFVDIPLPSLFSTETCLTPLPSRHWPSRHWHWDILYYWGSCCNWMFHSSSCTIKIMQAYQPVAILSSIQGPLLFSVIKSWNRYRRRISHLTPCSMNSWTITRFSLSSWKVCLKNLWRGWRFCCHHLALKILTGQKKYTPRARLSWKEKKPAEND